MAYGFGFEGLWKPFKRSYVGVDLRFRTKEIEDEIYSIYIDYGVPLNGFPPRFPIGFGQILKCIYSYF